MTTRALNLRQLQQLCMHLHLHLPLVCDEMSLCKRAQLLPCQPYVSQQHGDMQLSDGACIAFVEVCPRLAYCCG